MLPVIPIEMLLGKDNRHKKEKVLLESGSQINLIRTSTAKMFGLTKKGVLISIKKVGGEEEVLATKVYQLPITSLEPGAKITVKAVGIPQISDGISKSMLITRREERASLKYVPVDILIGIDRAYMHTRVSKHGTTS